jgi:hypothetical protein
MPERRDWATCPPILGLHVLRIHPVLLTVDLYLVMLFAG